MERGEIKMKILAYAGLLLIVIFSTADVFFGFAYYLHWNKYELFRDNVVNYSFVHSMFDFWLFSMVRVFLLLSAVFAVITDRPDALKYISKSRYPVGVLNILMVLYTLVKIMLYTEYLDGNHDDDPWFLTLGAWTMMASLIMYVIWINILQEPFYPLRTKMALLKPDAVKSTSKGNIDGERSEDCFERQSCHTDDDNDEEDDDKVIGKGKKSVKWYSVFARLISFSKEDWPILLVGIAALICTSVGSTFLPLLAGRVLDGVVQGKDAAQFYKSIVLMTVISCEVAIGNGVQSGSIMVAMARLNRRITNCLFDSILKQDMSFFDRNGTGAILSRLTSDTITMSDSLGSSVRICLRKTFQIVSNTVAMVILSWRLSVITVITLILLLVISDIVGRYYERLARKVQSTLANANIVAEETVSNIKTVRSFAIEKGEKNTYRDRLDAVYHLRKREAGVLGLSKVIVSACELLAFVVALFYGGHLVLNGVISGGMLFSYVWYQQKIGRNIEKISDGFAHLMKAAGASRKVFEMIDSSPKLTNEGRLTPREFKGHLEFRNVHFTYPSTASPRVLENVSFTASPGEVVALVGPSGGGKSSCVSLIERFYEPTLGDVLIDNISVREYDHTYLHTQMALVGPEPILNAKTIKDNISFGLDNCSMSRIRNAAEQANIHGFINSLVKGYATEIGEKGVRLSEGQKQRVALARALLRNPKILLLDGATSALDAGNEHQVLDAIFKKFKCRTLLIVTNNLSVIEKADRIVVIDNGRVVEQGCHQELMSANSHYARLVRCKLHNILQK
ncbi:ATP-binding cassette sub-family B member 9-like [Lytechinus variegatus]|uniref:ATP-binding cassette sub-family B member 9-like n=1 Tax=Lytechinus variegatus TaxID=7654 RepID=UPI001BB13909|nr:ATP-binding cassette sub-family B member 9-like [Lytechinus variegatus]